MKYMGSKRAMLKNGLGELLERELKSKTTTRFVDLFTGSSAVATHVAIKYRIPVVAYDLQHYSVVLANSIISRRRQLNAQDEWRLWYERARVFVKQNRVPGSKTLTIAKVKAFRKWCEHQTHLPITTAYGGHYFSPNQAVWLDGLRRTAPKTGKIAIVAVAALVETASECAASPGHTAQPFQPTRTAKRFLTEAWSRSIVKYAKRNFLAIANRKALASGGRAMRSDANLAAKLVKRGDLVFIDPPYSGVHYSRFYHVLETVSRGRCGEVSGIGRYPATHYRPQSRYSLKGKANSTLDSLLATISKRKASAILTFPDHICSNGLSGAQVCKLARKHFSVRRMSVKSKFSTLGGTKTAPTDIGRFARQAADELVLVLRPKKTIRRRISVRQDQPAATHPPSHYPAHSA